MADVRAVASGTADAQIITGAGRLCSFSAREDAGTPAAAAFTLRDGTSTSGTAIAFVELAANGSETVSFSDPIAFGTGLFLDRESGTTSISVHVE